MSDLKKSFSAINKTTVIFPLKILKFYFLLVGLRHIGNILISCSVRYGSNLFSHTWTPMVSTPWIPHGHVNYPFHHFTSRSCSRPRSGPPWLVHPRPTPCTKADSFTLTQSSPSQPFATQHQTSPTFCLGYSMASQPFPPPSSLAPLQPLIHTARVRSLKTCWSCHSLLTLRIKFTVLLYLQDSPCPSCWLSSYVALYLLSLLCSSLSVPVSLSLCCRWEGGAPWGLCTCYFFCLSFFPSPPPR